MTTQQAPGPDGRTITIDDTLLDRYRDLAATTPPAAPVRLVYAAAHLVMRDGYRAIDHSTERPGSPDQIATWIDPVPTRGLRSWLDGHGFGVAEAMDTAQRFQIGWQTALRLVRDCGSIGLRHGFIAGAGVDPTAEVTTRADLVDGVVRQATAIREAGGLVILLPLSWLVAQQCTAADYVAVYRAIFERLEGPLFVHWLGPMFAPDLRGYFPGESFLEVMALDPGKVRGCKLSLLDADFERRVRHELTPRDQVVMTGDDFHFAELIHGGSSASGDDRAVVPPQRWTTLDTGVELPIGDFSHGLLGVFDAIAEPAGLALAALARGDAGVYRKIMKPCERLGQLVFAEPTSAYKAGLAFVAWLNGLQDNFMLVNHEQRRRSVEHYLRVAELAARAGALRDADLAAERLRGLVADRGRAAGALC